MSVKMICEECSKKFPKDTAKQTPDGRVRCPRCFGVNTKEVS